MLLGLALGTLSILLTQLLLAAALTGIGLAARRAFGPRPIRLDDCFLAFWVGLACVTLFLLIWNFVLPVNGLALLLVLAAGVTGLFAVRGGLAGLFERDAWRPSAVTGALLLLAALWVANLSLGPLDNYDSALYHLQAVQWAEASPAVPGIGNLDGPLAFNNSMLLFDALLSAGPWQGRSNHLANGLLVVVFLWQGIVAGARLAAGELRPVRLFQFLLLAPAVSVALHGGVSSFVTDLAPTLVVMVVAARLYDLLADPVESAELPHALVALAALLGAAVAFKANVAVFAVAGFALVVVLFFRRGRSGAVRPTRPALWAAGVAAAFALAWMGRGVVLSGYPVFPTSFGGFPVEWRVPEEHADAELAYIVHSGRASTQNLPVVAGEAGFADWFPGWLRHALDDPFEVAVPLALVLFGVAAFLVSGRGGSHRERPSGNQTWWIALPLGLAVVAWFATAPEPRYAQPYFWSLAALSLCQALRRRLALAPQGGVRPLVVAATLLGVLPPLIGPSLSALSEHRGESPLTAVIKANFNRPGSDLWFHPVGGEPELRPYRTRSGLLLNTVPNRCWDAPLPCTPNPAANLRLRNPADPSKGFFVEGSWAMENWPMDWQPGFLAAWRRSRAAPPR